MTDLHFPATFDDPPLELTVIRGSVWIQVGRDRRALTADEAQQLAGAAARSAEALSDAL